jgi:hypothetical protein
MLYTKNHEPGSGGRAGIPPPRLKRLPPLALAREDRC